MKTIAKIAIIAFLIFNIHPGNAQTYNWSSLPAETRHVATLNLGMQNGVIYGLGYGYQFKTRLIPVIAGVEYSFPSGSNLFDDFKIKIGGQVRWVEFHNFHFSTKIYGEFRRYQNDFVRLANFGSDIAGVIGYYMSRWFVAGETGFMKAIVTNFKHSNLYRDIDPNVQDGWYEPATGGNFYYGLQVGYSFNQHDLYLKGGQVITQDFKTKPTIPYYLQIGYNYKFSSGSK